MKTIVYIAGIVLALVFAGCKKYPEDETRSFKTPMKRIERGWVVESMTIDNVDSTDRVYKSYFSNPAKEYSFRGMLIKFKKEKHPSFPDYRGVLIGPNGITGSQASAWNFKDKKDAIVFFLDKGEINTNTFQTNTKEQSWSILTLTSGRLEMVTVEAGRKIRLALVPA